MSEFSIPNFDPETMDLVFDGRPYDDGQQRAYTFKQGSSVYSFALLKKEQRDKDILILGAQTVVFLILLILMFVKGELAVSLFIGVMMSWSLFLLIATVERNISLTGNLYRTRQRIRVNIPDNMYGHPSLKTVQEKNF